MATISASTLTDGVFQYPTYARMDISVDGAQAGNLYIVVPFASNVWTLYGSSDHGNTWSSIASFTRANIVVMGSLFIDHQNYAHIVYRTNESSQDRIYYNRINLGATTPAWETELQVAAGANGGVAGALYTGFDFTVVLTRGTNGTFLTGVTRIPIGVCYMGSSTTAEMTVLCAMVTTATGVKVMKNSLIWPYNTFFMGNTSTGFGNVSFDLEHTGDGKTSGTPNVWFAWHQKTNIFASKLVWNGSGWTTNTKSPIVITTSAVTCTAPNQMTARYDGVNYFFIATPSASSTSSVQVYRRNKGNSYTNAYSLPTNHPQGVITSVGLSYNYNQQSGGAAVIRIFAVGTTVKTLYYNDCLAGGWQGWTQVNATAILGAAWDNWGVRRGITYRPHYDVYTAHASNVQTENIEIFPFAPNTPVITSADSSSDRSGLDLDTYHNGQPACVSNTLVIRWTFSDVDPDDSQSAWALSKQIGSGSLLYYRLSDQTWQATEQQNTSGSTFASLAGGWGASTDAATTFKVKYWDSSNTPSAAYSAGLVLVPAARVNPTITSPASGQVVDSPTLTLQWTVAEWDGYQIEVYVGAAPVPGADETNPVYNSGHIWDINNKQFTIPYVFQDRTTYTVSLRTWNDKGLQSDRVTVTFDTVFATPTTPTLVNTPNAGTGNIAVAITNPGGTGLATFVNFGTTATGSGGGTINPGLPASIAVDDAMICAAFSRRWHTFLLNPTFDSNTTSWVGTAQFFTSGTATLTQITFDSAPTDDPTGGACEVTYSGTSNWAGATQIITGVANTTYSFSCWVKLVSGPGVQINIRDTTNSISGSAASTTTVGVWTLLTATITTGATASPSLQFTVYASSSTTSIDFRFDEARVDTGTPVTPVGWFRMGGLASTVFFGKYYAAGDTAPGLTWTNGINGQDITGQIVGFRGLSIAPSAMAVQFNASAQNVAYPALTIAKNNQVVFIAGFKQATWTSVATLAGMTEIGDFSGPSQGAQVWDYVIQTTAANITASSFTVTGGVSAESAGLTMAVDVRPAVIGQDVYRRLAGQPATAQRIATDVPSGGTYQDYTAVSGVSYEYQVIAFGSNGTQQASAWTS